VKATAGTSAAAAPSPMKSSFRNARRSIVTSPKNYETNVKLHKWFQTRIPRTLLGDGVWSTVTGRCRNLTLKPASPDGRHWRNCGST
jgi:hypothetical protein